jgi:hypothetical protein
MQTSIAIGFFFGVGFPPLFVCFNPDNSADEDEPAHGRHHRCALSGTRHAQGSVQRSRRDPHAMGSMPRTLRTMYLAILMQGRKDASGKNWARPVEIQRVRVPIRMDDEAGSAGPVHAPRAAPEPRTQVGAEPKSYVPAT